MLILENCIRFSWLTRSSSSPSYLQMKLPIINCLTRLLPLYPKWIMATIRTNTKSKSQHQLTSQVYMRPMVYVTLCLLGFCKCYNRILALSWWCVLPKWLTWAFIIFNDIGLNLRYAWLISLSWEFDLVLVGIVSRIALAYNGTIGITERIICGRVGRQVEGAQDGRSRTHEPHFLRIKRGKQQLYICTYSRHRLGSEAWSEGCYLIKHVLLYM